jgi:ABC-type molybdate transport system substrate-binding protein
VTPYNTSKKSSYSSFGNRFTPPLYIFNYASGVPALLSASIDVSCDAGGTCGYDPTKIPVVGIADPSLAPYGVAAQSVLTGRYGLASPLCGGNTLVHQPCYQNITAVFTAVLNNQVPAGFVAMSAICSNGKYPTQQGTSALAYFSSESGSQPGTIVNNYNPLTQAGIAIENNRKAAQDTELADFVAFLTDFTAPPEEPSPMSVTLQKYCYNAP